MEKDKIFNLVKYNTCEVYDLMINRILIFKDSKNRMEKDKIFDLVKHDTYELCSLMVNRILKCKDLKYHVDISSYLTNTVSNMVSNVINNIYDIDEYDKDKLIIATLEKLKIVVDVFINEIESGNYKYDQIIEEVQNFENNIHDK